MTFIELGKSKRTKYNFVSSLKSYLEFFDITGRESGDWSKGKGNQKEVYDGWQELQRVEKHNISKQTKRGEICAYNWH